MEIDEINTCIEQSGTVLREAWENHAPQISQRMGELGKPVGDRFLRYQYEEPKDVPRTNILKRFKQFWAGSYLTRIKSGEIIFADLSYFRSLFVRPVTELSLEQSFFKINKIWFEVQKAFFAHELTQVSKLLLNLTQEIFQFRRMLAMRERAVNHESLLKSAVRRFFNLFTAR